MNKHLKILFIEDDQIESMKFDRGLKKLGLKHEVIRAENGEEALNILDSYTELPDIILLDLNMPRMNGVEFLSILKKNESLKYLPIIILTTSRNRKERLECFKIGIAGYFIKPLKYEEYVKLIDQILTYWSVNEFIKV